MKSFQHLWIIIFFTLCLLSCEEINENKSAEKKVSKDLNEHITINNAEKLENFKRSMTQIGETTISETKTYSKYLYFDHWFSSTSKLICLRDFANDTLSIVSYSYILEDGMNYISDSIRQDVGVFSYPHKLHKVVKEVSRSKTTIIFDYLNQLVKNKTIAPFGTVTTKDNSGCGGEWLVYFDGKNIYECQASNIDSLEEVINSSIHIEQIQKELFPQN